MASSNTSKIRYFLNHAPAWQKFPAMVIFLCVGKLILIALVNRLYNGGWEMNWAVKFAESLVFAVLLGLYWTWLTRTAVSENEQGEQQRSQQNL